MTLSQGSITRGVLLLRLNEALRKGCQKLSLIVYLDVLTYILKPSSLAIIKITAKTNKI